jgi:hypothetical protein
MPFEPTSEQQQILNYRLECHARVLAAWEKLPEHWLALGSRVGLKADKSDGTSALSKRCHLDHEQLL